MIDEILQRRPKKKFHELNIVPILDMLTTVIFFLLMSTTFIEYTKLTLPPAKTVTQTSVSAALPLVPRLLVNQTGNGYSLRLVWKGPKPGETTTESTEKNIVPDLKKLLQQFAVQFPTEKTLQVSMQKDVKYQVLISVMDGARDLLPDVVLLSYREASEP
jgi:biopolymer transport protein ExbD